MQTKRIQNLISLFRSFESKRYIIGLQLSCLIPEVILSYSWIQGTFEFGFEIELDLLSLLSYFLPHLQNISK